jgi:hypothetical protein
MKKIDRVIEHFRNLREMMAVGAGGFTSSGDPKKTAGFDPVMGKPQKRYLKGGKGSRKKWLDYLRNK